MTPYEGYVVKCNRAAARRERYLTHWRARADQALRDCYVQAFPKRKVPADIWEVPEVKRRQAPAWDATWNAWKATSDRVIARWSGHKKAWNTRMDRLAETATPVSDQTWRVWRTVYLSTYSTQGWGARKYAESAAQQDAGTANYYGIAAQVVPVMWSEVSDRHDAPKGIYAFRVEVQATEASVDLLSRKPDIPLRDWVAGCWRRGVNPRVYNPFLPHGYEASVGLDHQGRDAVAQQDPTPAPARFKQVEPWYTADPSRAGLDKS